MSTRRPRVGTFRIDGEVASVEQPGFAVAVGAMLVDSGSELTWIPASTLERAGIRIVKRDEVFLMANGESIARSIGYAIVRAGGFETVDEVVFALAGDLSLLGARTLEGFGAAVDARRRCLVSAGPHTAAAG
jgi:predicted aspartyl protease